MNKDTWIVGLFMIIAMLAVSHVALALLQPIVRWPDGEQLAMCYWGDRKELVCLRIDKQDKEVPDGPRLQNSD